MSERERSAWRDAGDPEEGAASIASALASRIDATPTTPGDAMDWAAIAAAFQTEAAALGARPAAAQLLFEAGRIYEERLGDAEAALAFHRRALELDPALLPNLRAARRLAMDAGDDALAADALELEAKLTPDPGARSDLLLMRGRLLAGLGRDAEAREVLAVAAAAAPQGFAAAEETARIAAASGERAALAEAYVRCARATPDRRLSAHYLSAASALLEEGLAEPDRAGELALEAFALLPEDGILRAAARRHAERLRRTDALAGILRAEAEASEGRAAAQAWHALAQLEENLGRLEDAIAALEHGRAAAPGDLLVLSSLARMREARGAWADASDALEALARAHLEREDPAHTQEAILAKLRRAEIEEGPLDRAHVAIHLCREVLALDRGNRSALSALGRLCARLGEWEGLLAAFEAEARAATDAREKAQRTFKAAEVLEERLGRVDDALARYREALVLDPELVPARSALERLCEAEERWEDLCGLLEWDLPQLAARGDRVAHLHRIGRLREERLRDLEGAAAAYERLLAEEPSSRVALAALEALLQKLGRFDALQALLAKEAAAAEDPRRRLAVLQRRAELIEEHLDDRELARSSWEEVRAAGPRHLPALRALGRLHARAGRWEELAAMYRAEADDAIDASTAADLVYRIGELMERRLGRTDDAMAAYREATMLSPSHAPALQALARLCRARGEDEALVEVLRAQAASRTSADERAAALLEAARVAEERLGDAVVAIDSYEEALRLDPAFAPALQALDRLYAQTGRTDELAALRRAPGSDAGTDRAERLLRLARLEADRSGDAAAALRATEELLAAAPDHPAGLLLELRLAPNPERRASARAALAGAAQEPEARAALLAAAALELRPAARRSETLARAAALAPASAALAPEEERRLRESGDDAALAAFCEARRDAAGDGPSRASWSVRGGEAWDRAGDGERALACFRAALETSSGCLPALRGARAILQRRGDWAAVRQAFLDEAAALRDGHGAAAALLEAGALAERLGDAHAAAADYRKAAEHDPVAPEPLRRLEALVGPEGAGQIAAVHEARAMAERDARRAADSWVAAARAALDGEGGAGAALAALDRALAARPDLPAALELRSRVHARAGRGAEALADLETCLAVEREPARRLPLHLSAAAVCDELQGQPARALQHLHAALELAPESPEALARLARLHAGSGRAADAAGALRRLVDVPGLPRRALLEHLLALADTEERLGDGPGAAAALRRALAADRGNDDVHRRLIVIEERSGDPERHLAALEAAAAGARAASLRAESHAAAARILAGELRAPDRAALHLRGALEIDAARTEDRAALARLLETLSPPDAAAEHRRLLAEDPLRVASWTALYRYFERTQAHDRAYVAATVLRWLGAPVPGPAAERLLLEGARQSLGAAPALADEDLALLRAPGDAWPLSGVMESVGDVVAASIGEPEAHRGEPARDHPLARALADAAKTFGAPAWELYAGALGRVDVHPSVPYAVLVGADVARRTTAREQRFLVGRAAARLRTRSCLAEALPAPALGAWVAAAIRCAVPGYAPAEPVDEEKVRRVAKGLARRARKPFEEAARVLAIAPAPPDLAVWAAASAATADRAGLVLCGDVAAAAGMLLRDGLARAPEGAAAVERAAARPDVLALLAFAASEAHFILRQRLRVAIA